MVMETLFPIFATAAIGICCLIHVKLIRDGRIKLKEKYRLNPHYKEPTDTASSDLGVAAAEATAVATKKRVRKRKSVTSIDVGGLGSQATMGSVVILQGQDADASSRQMNSASSWALEQLNTQAHSAFSNVTSLPPISAAAADSLQSDIKSTAESVQSNVHKTTQALSAHVQNTTDAFKLLVFARDESTKNQLSETESADLLHSHSTGHSNKTDKYTDDAKAKEFYVAKVRSYYFTGTCRSCIIKYHINNHRNRNPYPLLSQFS
jgi:hypothetical protein